MEHGWSLDHGKWQSLLDVIQTTAWRQVRLDELFGGNVTQQSGIYMICRRVRTIEIAPFDRIYNVIYVGQAENLRQRFLQHCRSPKRELRQAEESFGPRADYWYTSSVEAGEIGAFERALIDCFGPPANLIRGAIRGRLGDPQPA